MLKSPLSLSPFPSPLSLSLSLSSLPPSLSLSLSLSHSHDEQSGRVKQSIIKQWVTTLGKWMKRCVGALDSF